MNNESAPASAPTFSPREFMLAGNATITVENTATAKRFTFRVRQPEPTTPHFVSVLTGSDNESSYTFLGSIFSAKEFRHGRRSKITPDAASAKAFAWFWNRLATNTALPESVHVHHEGKCGRCGRKLTTPDSVTRGIGPECASQMGLA